MQHFQLRVCSAPSQLVCTTVLGPELETALQASEEGTGSRQTGLCSPTVRVLNFSKPRQHRTLTSNWAYFILQRYNCI